MQESNIAWTDVTWNPTHGCSKVSAGCGNHDTERVFVDWWSDAVQETRICNDCPTQYTIHYGDPVVEIDEVPA